MLVVAVHDQCLPSIVNHHCTADRVCCMCDMFLRRCICLCSTSSSAVFLPSVHLTSDGLLRRPVINDRSACDEWSVVVISLMRHLVCLSAGHDCAGTSVMLHCQRGQYSTTSGQSNLTKGRIAPLVTMNSLVPRGR